MNPIFEYSDTLNNPYEAFFFDAQKNNFPVSPHWHYFMEILYILKGTAYIETDTDNYVLEPGDLICFPPADTSCHLCCRSFSPPISGAEI